MKNSPNQGNRLPIYRLCTRFKSARCVKNCNAEALGGNFVRQCAASGESQGCWVLRLVEADSPAAGKRDPGDGSPPCFFDFGTADALGGKCRDLGLQIVAHQVEFVPVVCFFGMDCEFSRG